MLVFIKLPPEDQTETRTHHYSHIECDVDGCGARSPNADALLRGHGLVNMGWFIAPGQHRCPDHFYDEVPARGPQYRDQ